jgi:hypothetical protein
MMLGGDRNDASETLGRGRSGRHRITRGAQGVTHRSPVGDDLELPCCGRALSEVGAHDQITTDPAQVTCGG